jgi:hypothetical protein
MAILTDKSGVLEEAARRARHAEPIAVGRHRRRIALIYPGIEDADMGLGRGGRRHRRREGGPGGPLPRDRKLHQVGKPPPWLLTDKPWDDPQVTGVPVPVTVRIPPPRPARPQPRLLRGDQGQPAPRQPARPPAQMVRSRRANGGGAPQQPRAGRGWIFVRADSFRSWPRSRCSTSFDGISAQLSDSNHAADPGTRPRGCTCRCAWEFACSGFFSLPGRVAHPGGCRACHRGCRSRRRGDRPRAGRSGARKA